MRKTYLTLLFGVFLLLLTRYHGVMAQQYAYLAPVQSQHAKSDTKELKAVLASLEKKFHVYFTFESIVIRNKYISAEMRMTENLEETLNNVLTPLNLKFKRISDKYYSIFPVEEVRESQIETARGFRLQPITYQYATTLSIPLKHDMGPVQIMVSGTVTDETNSSLPGVNVLEKGTTNGTATDAFGRFTLNVQDEKSVLVFSFIGYETQEVPVESRSTINVSLTPAVQALQEVVVVGYGTVERKDLTGSVGSVRKEEIRDLAVTRAEQVLAGRVAGVQVKSISGEPGVAPQIRVRGIGSISAGAGPLYVIDGFPTDNMQNINPNDIETIDILKDASATAIYGSRGSNGVIIINTKRGKAGKPVLTFDTYYGWQSASKLPEYMNAREQAQYYYDGLRNRNIDNGNDVSGDPATWKIPVNPDVLDVLEGRNTTDRGMFDDILRTAAQQQYQLTATGGNEAVRYSLSGEYLDQEGIIINSDFKRYSLRANIDAELSKKLALKLNFNPSFTDANLVTSTGGSGGPNEGVIAQATNAQPFYPLFNDDGSYFIFTPGMAAGPTAYNPVALTREISNRQRKMGLLGNINAIYSITEDLNFNIMVGASLQNEKGLKFRPNLPVFLNNPATGYDHASMGYNWLTEYTLNYNKSFGDHALAALAGYTTQKERYESNFLFSNSYPNNLVPTLSATSGIITNGSSDVYEWSLLSYLARVNYNYKSKYYLTASIRTDGSSRFGSENKYGVFPSVALAWRISDEKFLKDIAFIHELKLRTSYGETGNNNIGNYEHYATINYLKYALGEGPVAGFGPARLANPSLTWEKQKSVNIGLDVSLFSNRIDLSVDHFRATNTDLLLNVNVAAITGFNTALQNIGEVKNTGWEFVLSTNNVAKKFSWTTDFNISTYKNEVVKLGPNGDPIYVDANVTMIGQPIGMFWGWLTDGIFLNQAEVDAGPIFSPLSKNRSRPGDQRFVDISGPDGTPDGIIDNFDKTIMGTPYPDFYYGMTNRFSYQNFGLSVSLQGSQGNQVMSSFANGALSTRGRIPAFAYLKNYWKSEDDPGDGKTLRPNDQPTGNARGRYSQRWLDHGSYLRINNITLSYTLPEKDFRSLGLRSTRVYLSATNPFIFTKNLNFNPDVSTSGNPLEPGRDNNDYPLPKSIVIGLNLSF